MKTNLAFLTQEEIEKIRVDLAAAAVAFKERHNIAVVVDVVEYEQPAHLKTWFHERLSMYRLASATFAQLSYRSKSKVNKANV